MNQLGEFSISNSIQKKAQIGLWAVEIDENCPPRMYADTAMLELMGLKEQLPPEQIFNVWNDNIDIGYVSIVDDYVNRMCAGEHAEVRYLWRLPSGEKRMIRCGGTRNFDYKKGIRLEGCHQDITGVVQLAEEKYNMVLEAVSDNYYMILLVDFETGKQTVYKCTEKFNRYVNDFSHLEYMQRNQAFCDKFVVSEDRDDYMQSIEPSRVISYLDRGEDYIVNYRAIFDKDLEWIRLRFFNRQLYKGKKCAILTVRNVTDEHSEEIKQMVENAVISGLSIDYSFVSYLNLMDGSYTNFKVAANSNFLKLKGDTYREKIEDYCDKFVYSKDRELFLKSTTQEFIIRNVAGGNPYFFDFRTVNKGIIHYDQIKFVPYFRDGMIVGAIAGYHNIDRQYIQRVESEEEHLTLSMLANSFSSVFYVDLNRDYYKNYYNEEQFSEIVTKSGSYNYLIKDFVEHYVDKEDKERCLLLTSSEYIRKQLAQKDYYKISYVECRENKKNYTLEFIKANADGSCFVLCRNDVTEVVKQEVEHQQMLSEALKMAKTANKAKTAFLSNMSHDIRTPMNAIIGFTGLAQSHIDNRGQVLGYLSKIKDSSDHLLSLINDVLDMSRIESGKLILKEEKHNLKDIISFLCDMNTTELNKKNMDFVLSFDSQFNENVICDRLRVNQILLNIISNSIKYTPKGGRISLKVSGHKAHEPGFSVYTFTITDNGMGMSSGYLDTIFEPFTREKTSTVSGIQGTGLGMAITKNLVDIMSGSIHINSEEGVGTEVTVSFKWKNWSDSSVSDATLSDDGAEALNAGSHKNENFSAQEEAQIDLSRLVGKKLLLVEDNVFNMEIAVEILTEAGFIVEQAFDGTEAVERIMKNDRFDAILMDIQMPVMDGYTATRCIRVIENDYARNIPIIAMTANAFDEDRKNALESGMNAHVSKPIDIKFLLKILNIFL